MKTKKNVLMVTSAAPSQTPFSTWEKKPPLGIGYLISMLRNAGHEVFFIDNYLKPSDFLETDYLQRNRIDYVGIYANTICFRDTLRMIHKLEYLRRCGRWHGKIIIGGPHTTVAPDTIPAFVDHVVQGEGEKAIVDIVDSQVRQRVVQYPRIHDLDALPMPAWDYFVKLPYDWGVQWFPEKPVFQMNTSRGCPFSCAFCSVGSIWGKKYTYFSAERIVSEIEYLIERYGAKGIYFREDNFTINRKRLTAFCNLILDRGIDLLWACETRVDTLDRDIVKLMYRAGARAFYFGVESGSQRILNFLKKGITVEQIHKAFQYCHEFGIKSAASIIIGVPTETEDDINQTLKLLQDIRPSVIWYNVFAGIPDSRLYRYVIEHRLHEFIDDRGLVYLKGHNDLAKKFYKDQWDAYTPVIVAPDHTVIDPKVSVIMAVHNGERFLEKAIKSILKQTFQNFEFIIVDDASTDKTTDILKTFDDPRITIYRNSKNLGPAGSRNRAIQLARGTYVAVMDADDISLPHRLATQIEFLERNPDVALVGSSYYEIDESDQIRSLVNVLTDSHAIKEGLLEQNWFGHSTIMVRKDVLVELGGYDERYKYSHDYEVFLRMSEHFKLANIAEPLCYWRSTPNGISRQKQDEQRYFAALAVSAAKERREKELTVPRHGPTVSVIVPTYNRPEMLVQSLRSVINQTYPNIEIIVVNDGGTDVENVVMSFNQAGRVTYVKHGGNLGLAATRNTGIKMAKGKYIAYLDDDDIYYPDHLETLIHFLEGSDYKVAYTDACRAHQKKVNGRYAVIKQDVPYSFDFDDDRILVENFVPVLCFMHEKSCLDEVGCFDEDLTTQEDWDLWIRLSRKFKIAHLPKVTCEFSWREDGTTMTGGKKIDFLRNMKRIYEKYREYSKGKPNLHQVQETFLKKFDEMVKQEYDRIQQLIKKNLIEEAISAFEKLLILSPTHSLAHDDLGVLCFHRGDKERALKHFIQSLQADPKNRNALKNLADLHNELGQPEEALRLYQMVLADLPADVEALLGMGNLCLQTGRPGEAKSFYTKVLEIEPENDSARQGLEIHCNRSSNARFSKWTEDPVQDSTIIEKNPKLVSILLLAHNQLEYTRRCLDSLFTQNDVPFELIIVDNGSTDETAEYLKRVSEGRDELGGFRLRVYEAGHVEPWGSERKRKKGKRKEARALTCKVFKVIRNEKNLGFAVGNNQGMAEAKGDYILLMNNDVVVTPGWLERMIAVAERDPKIGIVGPMSNYVSGPQWVEKVSYDTTTLAGLNSFAQSFAQRYSGQVKPFWRVVGFCMLIKRAVMEKIGGLDSRYGLGNFEDDDFSLRARLAGFESWIAEDCFVHHFGSRTFAGSRIDYSESLKRNWEIFKKKWGIPAGLAYGADYDVSHLLEQNFIPVKHYCPLNPKEHNVSMGEELFAMGDLEGAKSIFEKILSENPNHKEALNNLGVIAFQQGEIAPATSFFKKVLALDPQCLEAIENMGNTMLVHHAYQEAILWFEKALEAEPNNVNLLNSLANCLIQIEEFEGAKEVYNRSYQLDCGQSHVEEILLGLEKLKTFEAQRSVTH